MLGVSSFRGCLFFCFLLVRLCGFTVRVTISISMQVFVTRVYGLVLFSSFLPMLFSFLDYLFIFASVFAGLHRFLSLSVSAFWSLPLGVRQRCLFSVWGFGWDTLIQLGRAGIQDSGCKYMVHATLLCLYPCGDIVARSRGNGVARRRRQLKQHLRAKLGDYAGIACNGEGEGEIDASRAFLSGAWVVWTVGIAVAFS